MSWEVFKGSEKKIENIGSSFNFTQSKKKSFFCPNEILEITYFISIHTEVIPRKKTLKEIIIFKISQKKILKMPSFVLTDVWPLRTGDGDNNVVEFGSQWWWWIGLKLARKFKLHRSKPIIHMKFWWRLRLMNTSNLFGKKKKLKMR